ncbi:hypothetical protein U1Q18_010325 [Sarracenia purpurea var. burkii]
MSEQGEGRIEQGWNARTSIKGIGVAGDVRGVSTSSLSQWADRERFVNGEEGSGHGDEGVVFGRDRRTNAREGARDSGKRVASNYQLPKPNLTFAQAVVSGIWEDDAVRVRRKSHELGISKIVRLDSSMELGSDKGQDAVILGQDNLVVEAREVNEAWLKSCAVGILNEAIKATKGVSIGPWIVLMGFAVIVRLAHFFAVKLVLQVGYAAIVSQIVLQVGYQISGRVGS